MKNLAMGATVYINDYQLKTWILYSSVYYIFSNLGFFVVFKSCHSWLRRWFVLKATIEVFELNKIHGRRSPVKKVKQNTVDFEGIFGRQFHTLTPLTQKYFIAIPNTVRPVLKATGGKTLTAPPPKQPTLG